MNSECGHCTQLNMLAVKSFRKAEKCNVIFHSHSKRLTAKGTRRGTKKIFATKNHYFPFPTLIRKQFDVDGCKATGSKLIFQIENRAPRSIRNHKIEFRRIISKKFNYYFELNLNVWRCACARSEHYTLIHMVTFSSVHRLNNISILLSSLIAFCFLPRSTCVVCVFLKRAVY